MPQCFHGLRRRDWRPPTSLRAINFTLLPPLSCHHPSLRPSPDLRTWWPRDKEGSLSKMSSVCKRRRAAPCSRRFSLAPVNRRVVCGGDSLCASFHSCVRLIHANYYNTAGEIQHQDAQLDAAGDERLGHVTRHHLHHLLPKLHLFGEILLVSFNGPRQVVIE